MSKKHVVARAMAWVAALSTSACVMTTIDEPVREDIDALEAQPEANRRDPRLHRPRPLPPGWRALRCFPDPHKQYVAKDPEVCAAIRFYCPGGGIPFFDDCGCGCEIEILTD